MLYQLLTGRADPVEITAILIALVLGITVHEFSHAMMATWLGDPGPGRAGRLSLSPAAHLDVMGSLMFLVGGFGWGKPVMVNPYAFRANPRVGHALVAAAGPVSNVILAIFFAIPTRLVLFAYQSGTFPLASDRFVLIGLQLLAGIVFYNLILAFFNLIPVFPLDGFNILQGILPSELAEQFEVTRQYGFMILLLLLFAGGSILNSILYAPVIKLASLLTGF